MHTNLHPRAVADFRSLAPPVAVLAAPFPDLLTVLWTSRHQAIFPAVAWASHPAPASADHHPPPEPPECRLVALARRGPVALREDSDMLDTCLNF